MSPEEKEAKINRAEKFCVKLRRATFDDTDLLNVIEDIIYALCIRLPDPDRDYWENAFNYVKHDNKIAYRDERENFKELVIALLQMLSDYKDFIREHE